jgi:hypothetical protein
MQFQEIAAHFLNVFQGIGSVGVPTELNPLPGGEVVSDLFPFRNDFLFQLADISGVIYFSIFLSQFPGFLYLFIDLFDWLFEIEELSVRELRHSQV